MSSSDHQSRNPLFEEERPDDKCMLWSEDIPQLSSSSTPPTFTFKMEAQITYKLLSSMECEEDTRYHQYHTSSYTFYLPTSHLLVPQDTPHGEICEMLDYMKVPLYSQPRIAKSIYNCVQVMLRPENCLGRKDLCMCVYIEESEFINDIEVYDEVSSDEDEDDELMLVDADEANLSRKLRHVRLDG